MFVDRLKRCLSERLPCQSLPKQFHRRMTLPMIVLARVCAFRYHSLATVSPNRIVETEIATEFCTLDLRIKKKHRKISEKKTLEKYI